MRNMLILFMLASVFYISGCSSKEKKQIDACVNDIKSGLNDPSSFQMLSKKTFKSNNGSFRIAIEFTANNKLGGKVRKEEICGFASEKETQLDPNDFMNQQRDIRRSLGSIGIR